MSGNIISSPPVRNFVMTAIKTLVDAGFERSVPRLTSELATAKESHRRAYPGSASRHHAAAGIEG